MVSVCVCVCLRYRKRYKVYILSTSNNNTNNVNSMNRCVLEILMRLPVIESARKYTIHTHCLQCIGCVCKILCAYAYIHCHEFSNCDDDDHHHHHLHGSLKTVPIFFCFYFFFFLMYIEIVHALLLVLCHT